MAEAGFGDRGFPDGRVLSICSKVADVTISSIGRELGITRQGASKLVASLRARGYVTLRPSGADAREKFVVLTPRARALPAGPAGGGAPDRAPGCLGASVPRHFDVLRRTLDLLGGDQQPRLRDYLEESRSRGGAAGLQEVGGLRRAQRGQTAGVAATPTVSQLQGLGPWTYCCSLTSELEARVGDKRGGVTGEMTAVGEALLERVEPVLPARHPGVGRESVLEEVDRAAGPQHSSHLGQCPRRVRHRAQREGAERGVARRVRQWDLLSVEPNVLHRQHRLLDAAPGQSAGQPGRFDGQDEVDLGRVVRQVEA